MKYRNKQTGEIVEPEYDDATGTYHWGWDSVIDDYEFYYPKAEFQEWFEPVEIKYKLDADGYWVNNIRADVDKFLSDKEQIAEILKHSYQGGEQSFHGYINHHKRVAEKILSLINKQIQEEIDFEWCPNPVCEARYDTSDGCHSCGYRVGKVIQKALDDEKWIEKYNKLQNHTKELEAINEAHRKLNGELQTKLEQEHLKCQAYSDKSDYLENFVKDFMPYSLPGIANAMAEQWGNL